METSHSEGTDMERRSDPEAREKVMSIARKARTAMMCTYTDSGMAHGRPMAAVEYEDDALWFFTQADSRKLDEIARDPRVTLTYSDQSANDWLSIQGRATVTRDKAKAKELWSEPLRTWFPNGPEDEDVALIRVEAESAEYWDSPSGVVVFAYGYLKAALTGKPPAPGEVAQVDM